MKAVGCANMLHVKLLNCSCTKLLSSLDHLVSLPSPSPRRSMVRTAAGFGYGAVLAWAFVMSFFTLMCGLILEGFKDVVVTQLEKSE